VDIVKELCVKNVAMFPVVVVGVEDEMIKIKPVGQVAVAAMNARSKNSNIAQEQIEILKQGYYTAPSGKRVDITAIQEFAVRGTEYYSNRLPLKNLPTIVRAW
jgi:predicted RNA-binding protein associated with RNAse of E/G family